MPGRIAFVPLRYGPQIVGGSEAVTREAAIGLAARGWQVDVLTSRVIDHFAWADELPEGAAQEDGVTVRRFSSSRQRTRRGWAAQQQIQNGIMPPLDDQWTWVSWRYTTPDLFHYLLRHGPDYDAVVFSPYLFWHTIVGHTATPDNAIIMPCLHDESYARLDVMRPVLADARSVWFLSEPEHALAHRLGPVADHHLVIGAGVHPPVSYDPDGFRARHGLERPFVLYAGRREKDKGWDWLLDTFADAVDLGLRSVDLVTMGSGEVDPPKRIRDRVGDLGFLPDHERDDAFAAALAYVQPSRMESFSRTVMEAWLAGTPVLAVQGSAVVEWHVQRSGAGFSFADGRDLAEELGSLADNPDLEADLAEKGRRYVLDEYAWPVVLDRMESDLERFRS